MKTALDTSHSENTKRLNWLPASESQPLDGRVLAFQQFLMDRFGAGLGVPPPSLYQRAMDRLNQAK